MKKFLTLIFLSISTFCFSEISNGVITIKAGESVKFNDVIYYYKPISGSFSSDNAVKLYPDTVTVKVVYFEGYEAGYTKAKEESKKSEEVLKIGKVSFVDDMSEYYNLIQVYNEKGDLLEECRYPKDNEKKNWSNVMIAILTAIGISTILYFIVQLILFFYNLFQRPIKLARKLGYTWKDAEVKEADFVKNENN